MQTANTTTQTPDVSSNAIATAAYYEWVKAGCPQGRDQEFWLKAETTLKHNGKPVQKQAVAAAKAATPASSKRQSSRAQSTR